MIKIDNFVGIDNVSVPEKAALGSFSEASNVIIMGDGPVGIRPGYTTIRAGAIRSSFGVSSREFMVLVNAVGEVILYNGDYFEILGVVMEDSYFWVEESPSSVLLLSGGGIYRITPGRLLEAVGETPPVGLELVVAPLAIGTLLATSYILDRLCIASADGAGSCIRLGLPGYPGFESIEPDWFYIPHKVTWMESMESGLLITCEDAIYVYEVASGQLSKRLHYGAPRGRSVAKTSPQTAFMWTTRGVVTYPEFENKTITQYIRAPGISCSTSLVQYRGSEYFVVCMDGDSLSYDVQSL